MHDERALKRKANELLELPEVTGVGELVPWAEVFMSCLILRAGFRLLLETSETFKLCILLLIETNCCDVERKLLVSSRGSNKAAKPKIQPLPPPSVLDRLHSFLPALDKANSALKAQTAKAACLELEGRHSTQIFAESDDWRPDISYAKAEHNQSLICAQLGNLQTHTLYFKSTTLTISWLGVFMFISHCSPSLTQRSAGRLLHTLNKDWKCAEDDDQPHIALDLACGLLDLKNQEAVSQAERIMNGAESSQQGLEVPDTSDGSSSSGSSTSDSEVEASVPRGGKPKPDGDDTLVANSKHGKLKKIQEI